MAWWDHICCNQSNVFLVFLVWRPKVQSLSVIIFFLKCSFQPTVLPKLVQIDLCNNEPSNCRRQCESTALMLILEVRTWWSPIQQMLHVRFLFTFRMYAWIWNPGHVLDYCSAIDLFVTWNQDLHQYKLSKDDWTLITLVSSWLKLFHSATTQMSTMKIPMLSTYNICYLPRSPGKHQGDLTKSSY